MTGPASLRPRPQAKNKSCFGKGHPQMIRTVKASETGGDWVVVATGEVFSKALDLHYYYRIKPGTVRKSWQPIARFGSSAGREEGGVVVVRPVCGQCEQVGPGAVAVSRTE